MWLENCLLPQLQPGNAIVLDNASSHRSQAIEEIVAQAGCELWYLPPYSPDLNAVLVVCALIIGCGSALDEFKSFHDCVDAAFKYCPNVFA